MTPAGYEFRAFPHVGSKGGGIGFITRLSLSSYKPLPYSSFESVELKLSMSNISASFVCLYRPPPSESNKLLNSSFLREFPELLSAYAHTRGDVSFLSDFNFHYDDSSDSQVSILKMLWSDYGLSQVPRRNLKSSGERAFSFIMSTVWNSLPVTLRGMPTLPGFKADFSNRPSHIVGYMYICRFVIFCS